jgi:hypothetical protein
MALQPSGRVVVFMETPTDVSKPFWEQKRQVSINEEVKKWAEMEYDKSFIPAKRVVDKRFAFQKRGGTNLCNLFKEAGDKIGKRFVMMPSYKNESDLGEIAYGHKIVRSYFEPMDDGYSKLVVWDSCHHLINGIKHYVRKKQKTTTELNKASDDSKIIEKYKDFNDVLRYGLVDLFSYEKVIQGRKKVVRRREYTADPIAAIF